MPNSDDRRAIAVDLDGTLARDTPRHRLPSEIGPPVPAMLARVKAWIAAGKDVYIFTARVAEGNRHSDTARAAIRAWCYRHVGRELPITATKLPIFGAFYDDRAVAIESDTGRVLGGKEIV